MRPAQTRKGAAPCSSFFIRIVRCGSFWKNEKGPKSTDLTSPQTWNRYAYVTNNPVSYNDPSGLVMDICGGPANPHCSGNDPSSVGVYGGIGGNWNPFTELNMFFTPTAIAVFNPDVIPFINNPIGLEAALENGDAALIYGNNIFNGLPYPNPGSPGGNTGGGPCSYALKTPCGQAPQQQQQQQQQCEQSYNTCTAGAYANSYSCGKFRGGVTYGAIQATGVIGGFLMGGPGGAVAGYELTETFALGGGGIAVASCFPQETNDLQACANQRIQCLTTK